jgi:hypothetical protein
MAVRLAAGWRLPFLTGSSTSTRAHRHSVLIGLRPADILLANDQVGKQMLCLDHILAQDDIDEADRPLPVRGGVALGESPAAA